MKRHHSFGFAGWQTGNREQTARCIKLNDTRSVGGQTASGGHSPRRARLGAAFQK
jgi:hypothetical protein